jgi:hypothetical protein
MQFEPSESRGASGRADSTYARLVVFSEILDVQIVCDISGAFSIDFAPWVGDCPEGLAYHSATEGRAYSNIVP